MNYPLILETESIGYSAGATQELRIPARPERLEGIHLAISGGVLGGTVTSPPNGAFDLIDKIEVMGNFTTAEGNDKRTIVSVKGAAMIAWAHLQGFGITRRNKYAAEIGLSAAAIPPVDVWIPFRHPWVQDPVGYRTALPLGESNEDTIIRIKWNTLATIAGAGTMSSAPICVATLHLRNLLGEPAPYVPTELWTYESGLQSGIWQIPQTGRLASILFMGKNSSGARAEPLNDADLDTWDLLYGSQTLRSVTPRYLQMLGDAGNGCGTLQTAFVASTSGGTVNKALSMGNLNPATYIMDLMWDTPGSSAFSPGSTLNLDPVRLNGRTAKIRANNLNSGYNCDFTTYKILGDPAKMVGLD